MSEGPLAYGRAWAAPADARGPALAAVELDSIARAFVVADAMVKRAAARLWWTGTVSPGRYLILLRGPVAEVEEAYGAGLKAAEGALLDRALFPQIHPQIPDRIALARPLDAPVDALGIVETTTSVAALQAADVALKTTDITLVHLHLGRGIGGKGVCAFTGHLHDVQASLEASVDALEARALINVEEIAAPHSAMTLQMLQLDAPGPRY